MKFSTRVDSSLPADELFDRIGDFDAIERFIVARGARVSRIDPAREPGMAMGWTLEFDWRARARRVKLMVTTFDRPELIELHGRSHALDIHLRATVVALNRKRSRLVFETEVKPRNMKARLMIQTAKLGKSQLDRRHARRIEDFVRAQGAL